MNINEALNCLNISTGSFNVTLEEVKKAYRQMAKQYHLDHAKEEDKAVFEGVMKTINAAYDLLKKVASENKEKNPETDESINLNPNQEYNFYNYSAEFEAILRQLYSLDGLIIEICGNWVWIGGETKEHKEILKSIGCKWAKKKCKWFYRPDEHKSKNRSDEYDMNKIRDIYGSATFRQSAHSVGYKNANLPSFTRG